MKKNIFLLLCTILLALQACKQQATNDAATSEKNAELANLLDTYYEERMSLYPFEATQNGDNRFNDLFVNDISADFRAKATAFYQKHQNAIANIDRSKLNPNDQASYDIFTYEMKMNLEGLSYPAAWQIPFQQFWGMPLNIGQYGSGDNVQPFKTVKDYDDWQKRVQGFTIWADTAIANFKQGMKNNIVLPEKLVKKMIPQMRDLATADPTKSVFYGPILKMPATFSVADKARLTASYAQMISTKLTPTYAKLADFLEKEYLPKARKTSGINAIPEGDAYYNYLIRYWTTSQQAPEQIYETGKQEVTRIRHIMDSIQQSVAYKGSLQDFFKFMQTDKQFFPFATEQAVLDSFRNIQKVIDPNLKKMFGRVPKTAFEIRQTEKFREASASAEYVQGTADGTRPGIFYTPIPDPKKFNSTSGMQSLFLHEAIPGHHYQISLQQENEDLPKFRRFLWYGAYGEGWALYTESLGKELGLYTNPYQYMGALGDEMHRAIRLVVDTGLHTGKMTREQAIKYMMDNESISEDGATAEIERYMAIPAQALSYKIGSLKIQELRRNCEQKMGPKFNLAAFHDQLLLDGVQPLNVLERKMTAFCQ